MKGNRCHAITAAAVTAFTLAVATPHIADASGFAVISPSDAQMQTGMTYGEWSVGWWQYVLSKSTTDPNNPLLDQTGQGCGVDQPRSSPVFFLVGTFGSTNQVTATRNDCTIPAGKYLFFPLVNLGDIHFPGQDNLDTPAKLWADIESAFGPVIELHASVDGVPVSLSPATPYRTCAGGPTPPCTGPAYSVTMPGNNLFDPIITQPPKVRSVKSLRAGVYSPAVADGYYILLASLPPGPHTIKFGGTAFIVGTPFSQDITYNLFVK
ncbi:hypothetical protein [Paraburkholderia diazotrophica]|uniref:Uncharacterized protein n=1 Tax=Paraburkholderia diazotrophica TaxID=667676 RepID=A0A1H7E0I5_9BURK|nr:hypothetical protein [Paraburkholderia diazotrophica]SEK07348.1 hypothetical protein SAMN05192539_103847 [Paraburkholderia diazotrophica]